MLKAKKYLQDIVEKFGKLAYMPKIVVFIVTLLTKFRCFVKNISINRLTASFVLSYSVGKG